MSKSQTHCHQARLKVTSLNLFNYLAPPNAFYSQENIYTETQWQQKQAWLEAHLKKLNSDIIGFQEVFSISCLEQQMRSLGYKHVITIDTPHIENGFIYSQPVLALASRHPVIEYSEVKIAPDDRPYESFEFSRKPIHAVIDVPCFGLVDIYIVHFKSKRLELENEQDMLEVERWSANTFGRWLSTVQRGFEANLLHQAILNHKRKHHRPFMLMGDFNNTIQSEEFACFTFTPDEQNLTLASYVFHDGWDLLSPSPTRPPTHYYGTKSQTLDYILLSDEFCNHSANRQAFVSHYSVNNKHIIDPRFGEDLYSSDHASVSITISQD